MSRTVSGFVNHKMNNDVYKNKHKVLYFVYELKNEGLKLPYVRVKIGDAKKCNVLGKAKLNKCEIWITQKAIDTGISDLRNALKGTDTEEVKKKTQAVVQSSMKLGEAVYKSQQKDAGK